MLQHSGDYLADNYRDVQEQHHRHVIRSFPREIDYIVVERVGHPQDTTTESSEPKEKPRTAGASANAALTPMVIATLAALTYILAN